MPSPDIDTLYDLEGSLEAAIKAAVTATAGLPPAYTRLEAAQLELDPEAGTDQEDGDAFERFVERVEVAVRPGAATGHVHTHNEVKRPDCWNARLVLQLFTKTSSATTHGSLRAKLRALAANIKDLVNTDDLLPYHRVCSDFPADVETLHSLDTGLGIETSRLEYAIHINIRPDAWPVT